MKKKICMVLLRHSALDDRIYYKETRTLKNAGYDVHIICRLQNNAFTDMGGNPVGYPDSNGNWEYNGVTFHGIKKRKGLIGKWREYKDIVNLGCFLKADIYHCHESDIALNASIKIKKLNKNSKLIYDIHEFGTGKMPNLITNDIKNIILYLFTYRMKNAIKYCDYIITANDVVRARSLIYNRFKLVDIISNVPNLTIFNEEGVKETNSSIILCHEGSLSFNRGLKEMISLIEEQKYNLKLKIIGDIRGDEKKWLDEKIHNNPSLIKSIYITEWLPYEKVGAAIEECDIGLILFYPTINNMLAGPPNKLFNYMRYGLPIVTVDLPETRMVIRKYGCGLIVKNWDINTFIQSVKYLIDNPSEAKAMGQRGKEAIINELSWQKQGEKLLKIYDELLNPQPFIIA